MSRARATIADAAVPAQGNLAVSADPRQDKDVVRFRRCFCRAVEKSGRKHESIVAHMREQGVRVDGPYFTRLLTGEKPIRDEHIAALPEDIEALFAQEYAACFQPSEQELLGNLIAAAGQLIARAHTFPLKATRLAKAELK